MSSNKKPPLPLCSIAEMRPELFDLNSKRTKLICELFNHKQDEYNLENKNKFIRKVNLYKKSNY